MADTTHTPTPWTFDASGIVRSANGNSVCALSTGTLDGAFSTELLIANARLIAAAPDLLAALIVATSFIAPPSENLSCHRGITTADNCGRCTRAKQVYDAIAKAEATHVG